MEQQPVTAEALASAAQVASQLGRTKDHEAAWKRLQGEFPDHPLTRRIALDRASTALERASTAFKQKNWKAAVEYGTQAAQSDDDAVKAEGWLLVGESELKQKRLTPAARAFERANAVTDAEAGVRYRALAGLGLVREELQEWKAALTAYEAVANRSPDSTLRDWAKERAAAVRKRTAASPAPSGKPAPKKSNGNGAKKGQGKS
jgi:tetratricopeptide (TPR) repeat protein